MPDDPGTSASGHGCRRRRWRGRRGVGRVEGAQSSLDGGDPADNIADVEPDVGIIALFAFMPVAQLEQSQAIGQIDLDGIAASVGQRLGQELFQAGAVGKKQVGIVDGRRVGRGRHVAVGVGTHGHEDGEMDPVAADAADHVADEVGGGDYPELVAGGSGSRATGDGGQDEQEGQETVKKLDLGVGHDG